MQLPNRIEIVSETPGDSRTLFCIQIDGKVADEGLTAAQAHLLIGEILARIAMPFNLRKRATQRAAPS